MSDLPTGQADSLVHDGQRLAYTVYGEGDCVFVLLHGLLLSQEMHRPLAAALAAGGHRVVTMDLLGHGASSRPVDEWRYSMPLFSDQVVALLDHLELERAVVGGTSLGANVTLEVAAAAPSRLQGMFIEMPVLDNALLAAALVFTPLAALLRFGRPVMRGVAAVARAVPRSIVPYYGNVFLDVFRQDPGPSSAVIAGLLFGRVAPPRSVRRLFEAPTLIIGHPRDPIHPFSDADMLAQELPNGRLLEAESLLELRLRPERLTTEIAAFLDLCWGRRLPLRRPSSRRAAAS
jgi:pimeloyl-ACP methyl ester carboxylesterase